jgi:hypothetical protein
MDVNNPYKNLGGGALDQYLFEKSTKPEAKTGRKRPIQAAPSQKKPRTEPAITPAPSATKSTPQTIAIQPQSTRQSTGQATSQSISQVANRPMNKIVDRPKAFYITERLDENLDKAVTYLQRKHGIKKVDRSAIVNALLDQEALWTDEALDQLIERIVSQLTSRLVNR